jgi:hypothetical protein
MVPEGIHSPCRMVTNYYTFVEEMSLAMSLFPRFRRSVVVHIVMPAWK